MKQFMEYMELFFFVAQVVVGLDDVPFKTCYSQKVCELEIDARSTGKSEA